MTDDQKQRQIIHVDQYRARDPTVESQNEPKLDLNAHTDSVEDCCSTEIEDLMSGSKVMHSMLRQ